MITARIAVSNVAPEKMSVSLVYKVLDSVTSGAIKRVQLHRTHSGSSYFVSTFDDPKAAKAAYDACEGTEVEGVGVFLDMSFIPDGMELDAVVDECIDASMFEETIADSEERNQESMVELSSDENVSEALLPVAGALVRKKSVSPVEKSKPRQRRPRETKQPSRRGGFSFDPSDERFSCLFTDADFTLDASNAMYSKQHASRAIVEEKRRQSDAARGKK